MQSTPGASRRPLRGTGRFATYFLIASSAFILYGAWLPFDFRADGTFAEERLRQLGAGWPRIWSITDVVSNVLLFMPLGIAFACRREAQGAALPATVVLGTLSGLALSALVEAGQLFLPGRTPSLVDLATNAFGAALGAVGGGACCRGGRVAGRPRLEFLISAQPFRACALAAALGLILSGLAPFDLSIDVGDLKAAVKNARPIPFGPAIRGGTPLVTPGAWAEETFVWALMGGVTAMACRAGRSNAGVIVAAVARCGALAFVIEIAQLAIRSRRADTTTVVFALMGALAGAAAVVRFPRHAPRDWAGPALALWLAAVTLDAWTPLRLAPHARWPPGWSQLVPFWSYYEQTNIEALADLFKQVLSFLPLGALMAVRRIRRPTRWSALVGLAVGSVLEAGQLLLADRTGEITDVLSAGTGAWLGARFWQWGAALCGASGWVARTDSARAAPDALGH